MVDLDRNVGSSYAPLPLSIVPEQRFGAGPSARGEDAISRKLLRVKEISGITSQCSRGPSRDAGTNSAAWMSIYAMPLKFNLWMIWSELGYLYRAFCLVVSVACVYTLVYGGMVLFRLRSINRDHEDTSSLRRSLAAYQDRLRNVRQLVAFMLYLLGFVFFLELPSDLNGGSIHMVAILGALDINCAFAAYIFFVLLIVHSVQWFVSARIHATLRKI